MIKDTLSLKIKVLHRAPIFVLAAFLISFPSMLPSVDDAAEEKAPSAEAILDRFIEVTGGKEAYSRIHNEVSRGVVEFVAAGIRGSLQSFEAEPNKVYSVIELEGAGKIEEGTDGQVVWEQSALQGPRVKTGEERAVALREATFNSNVHWRELYGKAECTGKTMVDGRACYSVVLTPAEGKPLTEYFDIETNLLVKADVVVENPMGEIPSETLFSDYRKVAGILVPFGMVHRALSQEIAVKLESVRFNAELPKERFDLPAEIRALVKKSRTSDH
jgi:hypothetical protein